MVNQRVKPVTVSYNRLTNAEIVALATSVLKTANTFATGKPVGFLNPLWALSTGRLQASNKASGDAGKFLRGNETTEVVDERDEFRDDDYISFWDTHGIREREAKQSKDLAKTTAVNNLHILKKNYIGLTRQALDVQSVNTHSFVNEAQSERFSASITTLGMDADLQKIITSQAAFDAAYDYRHDDKSIRTVTQPTATELRPELEADFIKFIEHIDSMVYYYPELKEWSDFLAMINETLKIYATKLKRRADGLPEEEEIGNGELVIDNA